MESLKQRSECTTGSGATAPKKKTAEGFEAPGWHLVGPGVPVGIYPNIWCPRNYKNQLLQSLWDGFSRVCLNHSLGWFCSHHGSVSGAAWAQGVPTWPLCQTQPFPAPTQGLSPHDMPRVNAHGPGQGGFNNTALVAILATGKS